MTESVESPETFTETEELQEIATYGGGPDLVDALIDALNDGVTGGIVFDRDLIDTNRPGDWGAVSLATQDDAEWADGRMIDQSDCIRIWACVSDRGSGIKRQVQDVLQVFCEAHRLGWRFVSRNYAADLDKFEWCWEAEDPDGLFEPPEIEAEPAET